MVQRQALRRGHVRIGPISLRRPKSLIGKCRVIVFEYARWASVIRPNVNHRDFGLKQDFEAETAKILFQQNDRS